MKVLVVGSGAREHALAWKLSQSPLVGHVLVAPGNAGSAEVGENLPVDAEDLEGLVALATDHRVDLTIVGPEVPLVAGIVDQFQAAGLRIFGPSAAAARIEGSKRWANDLMQRHGIPTAAAAGFTSSREALAHLETRVDGTYVIKADGLAAGKGVLLPETRQEAVNIVVSMLDGNAFGAAGKSLLIEDRLSGPEVSVLAFVHGRHVSAEVAACDYKRVNDSDEGPNTGGMGSYSPPEFWTPGLAGLVRAQILEPVVRAMVAEGCAYSGILYAGLMVTIDGPKVIEFNARFGDPECEVLMPRMKSDLAEVCLAVADGRLDGMAVDWGDSAQVGVVMAPGGYPGKHRRGMAISGLDIARSEATVFHAGTERRADGAVLTSGGRTLVAVGGGAELGQARTAAYRAIEKISFEGAHYRTDIALRAVRHSEGAGATR